MISRSRPIGSGPAWREAYVLGVRSVRMGRCMCAGTGQCGDGHRAGGWLRGELGVSDLPAEGGCAFAPAGAAYRERFYRVGFFGGAGVCGPYQRADLGTSSHVGIGGGINAVSSADPSGAPVRRAAPDGTGGGLRDSLGDPYGAVAAGGDGVC